MEIHVATKEDLPVVQKIAHDTWPATYGALMSEEQFTFMIDWMYSLKSLEEQFNQGQIFILAIEAGQCYGFASYELNYHHSPKTKIHKLYVLPSSQGKGVGKLLIQEIKDAALAHHHAALILNVKRDNKALDFYNRIGFTITDTVDIDIGHGFMMQDYVMEMNIQK